MMKNVVLFGLSLILLGCVQPMKWPAAPLYELPKTAPTAQSDWSERQVKQALVGHYAHYDIVAYEDNTARQPMRSFIISYGFTDFRLEGDQLLEQDRFCRATHQLNYDSVTSFFSDQATQAIVPPPQAVEVTWQDGLWQIYRPATPTLLGITGNPALPLTKDPGAPDIIDADGDGKPGVTVNLTIAERWQEELYIIRREIFSNLMWWYPDGSLRGYVIDQSEQLVIGASRFFLNKASDPAQAKPLGLSPIWLVPIDEEIDTCAELMAQRDRWFPPEPRFEAVNEEQP